MAMNPRLLRPILSGDPDALRYIAAVQQADGQSLETAVKKAITDFVTGCKSDGIWDAIKAACILAGAKTLSGALTPLKGSAPTNNGPFVSGDYDRKLGLVGNGSSKYLNTNRNANADPQDNFHMAFHLSQSIAANALVMGAGAANTGSTQLGPTAVRCRNENGDTPTNALGTAGLHGMSRSAAGEFNIRASGASQTFTRASQTPFNGNLLTHARDNAGPGVYSAMRISYYSIGESLSLTSLESRVSALMTAIGNAI